MLNHWKTWQEIKALHINEVKDLASNIICVCGPRGECTYCKAKAEYIERLGKRE